MKKIVVSFILVCCSTLLSAQTEQTVQAEQSEKAEQTAPQSIRLIVDDMQDAVVQDSLIYNLLDRRVNGNAQHVIVIDGYRLQVFSSNQQKTARDNAQLLEQRLREKITEPIYVQYISPFWKVRVGNFRTIQDASDYKEEFKRVFPDLENTSYVVRDKIDVLQ